MRAPYLALIVGCMARSQVAHADIEIPKPPACLSYTTNDKGGDADCDIAIAKETDPKAKSVLLFRRAYMEDAARDFNTYPKAITDLDEAIKLWPDNALALHERGYLYNENGRWKEAEADLNVQIRLLPSNAQGYQERALARFNLGDLKGTFDDRNAAVLLQPDETGNYLARADAAMWVGNFDLAKNDLAKAVDISKAADKKSISESADKRRAILALWIAPSITGAAGCSMADKAGDYKHENLIGDCTRAFLDATTPKARANKLTVRSVTWLVGRQDSDNASTDSIVAAGIDPSAENLSNLGFAYIRNRHSTAAIWVFDRSIALEPSFVNYSGRAHAKLNLGDFQSAIADAQMSQKMQPNEVALTVLGDAIYATKKSYADAKGYWIAAYRLGDRDDDLIARLKDAGVPVPPPDDPKETTPAK